MPLVWLNTPANPTGRVLPVEHLRKVVTWARERGAVVAVDECYLECAWETEPVSVLDPAVNGGSLDSILAVHSLSKRSNLAGYRAAFVAGDPAIVSALREVRRHSGLMVPVPVQAAMEAALDDDGHIEEQRQRYHERRGLLRRALEGAGFRIDHSEASLYLWVTRDEPCMDTVAWLAERGILVAPGDFYGPAGARHVRVALTATDERVGGRCHPPAPGGVPDRGGQRPVRRRIAAKVGVEETPLTTRGLPSSLCRWIEHKANPTGLPSGRPTPAPSGDVDVDVVAVQEDRLRRRRTRCRWRAGSRSASRRRSVAGGPDLRRRR